MNICVFCGSSSGNNTIYSDAAKELGEAIGQHGHTLIYGGGNIGLMGKVADSVLDAGGKVIGVIPDFLVKKEVAHASLTQLDVVSSMHERKKRMADLTHHFIAIPGGWGTLDELAEILTWRQLGLIDQPVTLLNVNRFFDGLLAQMQVMVKEGFLREQSLEVVQVANTLREVKGLFS